MNRTAVEADSYFEPILILRWVFAFLMVLPVIPLLDMPGQKIFMTATLLLLSTIVILRNIQSVSFTISTIDPWIWALFAYTTLSIAWAPETFISVRRVTEELTLFLVCIALLTRGYISSLLTTKIRIIATVALFLSIATSLLWPEQGVIIDYDGGNKWTGILNSKNQLGRLCLLCVAIYAFMAYEKGSPKFLWRLTIITLSVITLFFTDNATSMVVLFFILILFLFAYSSKKGWSYIWYFAFGTGLIALGFFISIKFGYPTKAEMIQMFMDLIGRDGLTGREHLWIETWARIMERPWHGNGFGGAWLGSYEEAKTDFAYVGPTSWVATQAHNAYLDILLKTGFIGLGIWTMIIISHVFRLIRIRRIQPDTANLHFALLIIVLACSIFSTLFYRGLSGPWNIILWVSITETCYLSSIYRHQQSKLTSQTAAGT